MAGAIQQIFSALKSAASATKSDNSGKTKTGLEGLADSMGKVNDASNAGKSAMGAASAVMGTFSKAISTAAGAAMGGVGAVFALAGGISGALTDSLGQVMQLVESIQKFVELANPGVVQLFTIALNDTMAVIGGMLTPIMEGLTIYVKLLGDAFAKLAPVLQPLFNSIGQAFANYWVGLGQILEAMAPIIELVIDQMVVLVDAYSRFMAFVQGMISEVIKTITELFGLKSTRFNPKADSDGSAVRGVKVSSIDQFNKDVFQKSLTGAFGTGGGKKPEEHIPDILKAVNDGKEVVRQIKEGITSVFKLIEPAVKAYLSAAKVVDKATGGIPISPAHWLAQQAFK
jgi:phage-related protein